MAGVVVPGSEAGEGNTRAWACHAADGPFSPFKLTRPAVGDADVAIKVSFCGICHSDYHTARSEWGPARYPCIPGHEVVGVVSSVGPKVSKFKVGDSVGVGCMVGSCKTTGAGTACSQCARGKEQYCKVGRIGTYNSKFPDGTATYGGYTEAIVVNEAFVLRLPPGLDMAHAAPLLCAGITTYSPMMTHGLNKKGMRIGVVGLGGLGIMAVKFGVAFGCVVTVISHSPRKEAAATALGATRFLVSSDPEALKAAAGSLDGIIDTVSADHPIGDLLSLLDVEGKLVIVGVPPAPLAVRSGALIGGGKTLTGSLIGGIQETQACLDFCAEHSIVSEVELIPVSYLNEAYSRLSRNDVHGRFVIDMATL